jgi:predicted rRNA methylase YqxC with S4 and FtsJ domains
MALLGALCAGLSALGFTHRSLRARVSRLLGADYTTSQMSYDLARLRLNGLIERDNARLKRRLKTQDQRQSLEHQAGLGQSERHGENLTVG